MIGNGPLLKEIQASNPAVTGEAPCAYHYTDGLPLHKNTVRGIAAGKRRKTVATEAANGTPVKAITLDIGANDQLHLIAKIEAEVKARQTKKVEGIATAQAEQEIAHKVEAIALKEIEAYVIEQVIPQAHGESGGVEPAFAEDIAKDAAVYSAEHAAELAGMLIPDEETYAAEHGKELGEEGLKLGAEDAAKYVAEHGAELTEEGNEVAKAAIEADAPALFAQIVTNLGRSSRR